MALQRLITRRIGYRGAFLLAIALIQGVLGWSTLNAPPGTEKLLNVLSFLTLDMIGWATIALAVVVAANSFWPPGRDRVGFMAAYPMPMFWGLTYTLAVISNTTPFGIAAGVRSATVWWGYAAMILIVSGMVGISDVKAVLTEAERDGDE